MSDRWPSLLRRTGSGIAEEETEHLHDARDITGEFDDVTVAGDIRSANWDGGSDLSSPDLTATEGYFGDSSEGAWQMKHLWITPEASVAPELPAALTVTDGGVEGGVGRLEVSWTASTSPDVAHVAVRWRRSNRPHYGAAMIVGVGETSCMIDALKANRAYDVKVRAVTSLGRGSAWSNPVVGIPGSAHPVPSAPTLLGVGSNGIMVFHDLTLA
jgi:hypothetical protein